MICSRSTIVPYQQRKIARNHFNCWPAQVPVLTSLFLVFFFIRRHTFRSGREEVHCARFEALSFEICVTWGLNHDCQQGLVLFEFQVPCTRGCPGGWTKASNHRQFQPSIGPIEKFPLNIDFRVFFIECLSPALEVILGFKYLSN